MATEVASRKTDRFPFGSVALILGAFAGGPFAALILLLMVWLGDLMVSNSWPQLLSIVVVFPLAAVGLLFSIGSLALMILLPITMFRFLDQLLVWRAARKQKSFSEPLLKTIA